MKIDASIEAEFKTSLFDIFETKLGVSVTTGFDWSHAGSKVCDSIVEIDVITTVQPGKFLKVQQAVGMVNDLAGSQRALRLPLGIILSKHKLLIFYIFLLATLLKCNFLAILGCH